MFNVLTGCQAMQQMLINISKNNSIHSLLQKQFPAIKSSDNKPTYYVTPKTIGYIHAIVTDCIPRLPSDTCNQHALRNETMILEVLEAQEPAVFRQQLFSTLTKYYEEIQSMSGAGRRPKPKHFKRTMIADARRRPLVTASRLKRRQLKRGTTHRSRRLRRWPLTTQLQTLRPTPPQERGKRAWQFGWGKGPVVNNLKSA